MKMKKVKLKALSTIVAILTMLFGSATGVFADDNVMADSPAATAGTASGGTVLAGPTDFNVNAWDTHSYGDASWADYKVEFDIADFADTSGDWHDFKLQFRNNDDNYYWAYIANWGMNLYGNGSVKYNNGSPITAVSPQPVYADTPIHYEFDVIGSTITGHANGTQIFSYTDDSAGALLSGGVSWTAENIALTLRNFTITSLDSEGAVTVGPTDYSVANGQSASYGDSTWMDYKVAFDISDFDLIPAGWNDFKLQFRNSSPDANRNPKDYYWAYIANWGMNLYGNGAVRYNDGGALTGINPQPAYTDTPIHYEFDVIGSTITGYADGTRIFSYTDTNNTKLLSGGVSWKAENLNVKLENFTITLLKTGDGGTGGSGGKKPITDQVTVGAIKVPQAGVFPTSRYHYLYNNGVSDAWAYRDGGKGVAAETITWDPLITSTFNTNTVYTATVTLQPIQPNTTFAGFDTANLLGLPTVGVTNTDIGEDGDNLVVKITYASTGSMAATFNENQGLLFDDEFDGTSLDTAKWVPSVEEVRAGGSAWDNSLIKVEDGHLALGMKRDPQQGTEYGLAADPNFLSAGAVQTALDDRSVVNFENAYGYYESSVKFPQVANTWGAFWLYEPSVLIEQNDGLDGTEIDILETIGNADGVSDSSLHWNGYGGAHAAAGTNFSYKDYVSNIYDGNFHKLGLQWTPSGYTFYIDGKAMWKVDGGLLDQGYGTGSFSGINQNPLHLMLSIEKAGGALPADFTYDEMQVDYVRVYDRPKYTVDLSLAPVYDAAGSQWQIQATLTNTASSGEAQTGTVTLAGTTKQYTVAPGNQQVLTFAVDAAAVAGIGSTFTADFTTGDGGSGSASVKLGALTAVQATTPVTIDGNLEDDPVWGAAQPISFNDGTSSGMRPSVAVSGQLAWDKDNLYLAVTAKTPDLNQNQTGGNIWQGDGVQLAVRGSAGYREMGFALNPAQGVQQWNWGADGTLTGNSAIPADMATTQIVRDDSAGTTTYEIAIKWAYLGLDSSTIDASSLYDIALVLNDSDGSNRGYLAVYDGIATGSKGVGMGKLVLAAAPPITPPDVVDISGVPVHFTANKGAVSVDLRDQSLVQSILNGSGSDIVMDFTGTGASSVEVTIDVSLFKKLNKTVVIMTKDASYAVTTQKLWNNAGKPRIITVKNGKLDFKNG
ncbi:family 16 glycosylhydrolase [Paenibacillus rhizovicinus]|uniref:Family 16 glycosylhydrolase n=1 Tax=Paenibacillus rhizovicinus TaxID=2704463 RepID=A0A6C0NTN1_9BACL|nr:family 16 glycosylhydrolase [Paenibacillus rhizovicinus]QHW29525.1 family 16 glycosylhydrolase [Paenibacillus rhizovicinus]